VYNSHWTVRRHWLQAEQNANTITPEPLDIITKFSRRQAVVENLDKFENGYREVRGCMV